MNLGNWGKRDISSSSLTPDIIQSNLDENNAMNDLLIDKIRSVNIIKINLFFFNQKNFISYYLEYNSTTFTSILRLGMKKKKEQRCFFFLFI